MTTSASIEATLAYTHGKSSAVALLREMLLIRELEERVIALSQATPPQVIGSTHSCAGQEGVPVGTPAGLRESDQILPLTGDTDGLWLQVCRSLKFLERFAIAASA